MNHEPPHIVVLDGHTLNPGDNPWDPIDALGHLTVHPRTPPDQVLERAADATIVLTNKTPLTRDTLAALPQLRLVGVLATGYDVVDVRAAAELGITVCNVPEYGTAAVAEFVFALLFALYRRIETHDAAVRQGQWADHGDFSFWLTPQRDLAGQTLGIVGPGRIGQRVARLAHAFDMHVLLSGRPGSAGVTEVPGDLADLDHIGVCDDPDDLFQRADIISLHCPLTDATRHLVDARRLARVTPGTVLINTARGALVDEHALADALHRGQLAGAALDVVSTEPIADDNPLLTAPNCILTPHIAWASLRARRRLTQITADNIAAFLAGNPRHTVG